MREIFKKEQLKDYLEFDLLPRLNERKEREYVKQRIIELDKEIKEYEKIKNS